MRIVPIGIAVVCASMILYAQIDKPSPIPSRNKKRETVAPEPPPSRAKRQGDADRSVAPTGDTGIACFYKPKAGSDAEKFQAVHTSIPTGTKVRLTNLGNSKTVVVTISGHGDLGDRLISVSQDAAEQLAFTRMGTATVKLEVVRE